MPLAREKKQEVIGQYAVKDGDTGSPEVQIALLTERIRDLNGAPPPLPEGQPFAPRPPQARWTAQAPARVPVKKDATRYRAVIGSLGLRR